MTPWSYWQPDVMPYVPGCPVLVFEHELRRAAQIFLRASRAWQVDEAPRPVTAGQAEVSIAPGNPEQELVRLEAAWYDGRPLRIQTSEQLDLERTLDWISHTGAPDSLVQMVPGVVRLYPIPLVAADTGLRLRLSVAPSDVSTGLPDDIAVRFREEMTTGVLARLMLQIGKPWTNPDRGMMYEARFNEFVGRGNVAAARSFSSGRIAANPKWC